MTHMATTDEILDEVRNGFKMIDTRFESLESRFTNFGA